MGMSLTRLDGKEMGANMSAETERHNDNYKCKVCGFPDNISHLRGDKGRICNECYYGEDYDHCNGCGSMGLKSVLNIEDGFCVHCVVCAERVISSHRARQPQWSPIQRQMMRGKVGARW